jgi:cytidine deaminase
MSEIDWTALRHEAIKAKEHAYAPYPRFPVGLVAIACVGPRDEVLMPCGRCRQLLSEHGDPGFMVDTPAGPRPMAEILPQPFSRAHLERDR